MTGPDVASGRRGVLGASAGLRVHGLSKRFGDLRALSDVSFTVASGSVVGFLGPNGSGKTTTMRAIMGLISIDAGEVTWRGELITAASRRRFGYMPAERGMYPKMRVAEQLVYFARLAGCRPAEAHRATSEWLERLDLADRRDDEVQTLSSGNQQRVQLAIALVHDPELLILDEPFSGLDPLAVETMKEILLGQVAAGATVLLSSHQLDLVADVCGSVVIVSEGRVVLGGDVAALRASSPVRDVNVRFAAGTRVVAPTVRSWDLREVSDTTLRLRVPVSVDARAVFDAVGSIGPVVEFDFGPPELSEVFVRSVAAAATDGDARSDLRPGGEETS